MIRVHLARAHADAVEEVLSCCHAALFYNNTPFVTGAKKKSACDTNAVVAVKVEAAAFTAILKSLS